MLDTFGFDGKKNEVINSFCDYLQSSHVNHYSLGKHLLSA